MHLNIGVTTAKRTNERQLEVVKGLIKQFNLPFFARNKNSITSIIEAQQLDYLFVVESEKLYLSDGKNNFFWHPNTAILKLKDNNTGPLVKALDLKHGDHVLDCTLGLGADSLLIANAIGKISKVTALEANPYIAYLTTRGICTSDNPIIKRLAKRIDIINCNYQDYLKSAAQKNIDVIYFDPMFKHGNDAACGITPLRKLATKTPLTLETIHLALTAAKRRVVVKERFGSGVLRVLKPDFIVGERRIGRVVYGVFVK